MVIYSLCRHNIAALDAPSLVFFDALHPWSGPFGHSSSVQIRSGRICPSAGTCFLNHSYGYAFGPRIKYGAGSCTR